jgi:hypothetical protein
METSLASVGWVSAKRVTHQKCHREPTEFLPSSQNKAMGYATLTHPTLAEVSMAILLRGKTQCQICGEVIFDENDVILFPHFILNENDRLFSLSDSACHSCCVRANDLGLEILDEARIYFLNVGPEKRRCLVCKSEIIDPDNYLLIGRLGGSSIGELTEFNYTHLHKSHIKDWAKVDEFLKLANAAVAVGQWRGTWLPDIITQIEAWL